MNQNMPPVTKNLIIINVLMFLATLVTPKYGVDLTEVLGLHYFMASDFRLYQLFTYMFMHGSWTHIFFNMFAVWMFGRMMEQVMGSQRFLFYYVVCGLGAGLVQEGAQYLEFIYEGLADYDSVNVGGAILPMDIFLNRWTTVGASGAVYGVLLSFGMTFPEERMFIIPIPFPIKAKWFVLGYAVIELMSALGHSGDGVAHMAHLGGMLFGWALIMYWRHHPGGGSGRFFGGGGGYGGFGGYNNYFTRYEDVTNTPHHTSFSQQMRRWWQTFTASFHRKPKMDVHYGHGYSKHDDDMKWRQQKQQHEAEVDEILAKIKQGGYASLTDEEKRKLFDASQR